MKVKELVHRLRFMPILSHGPRILGLFLQDSPSEVESFVPPGRCSSTETRETLVVSDDPELSLA